MTGQAKVETPFWVMKFVYVDELVVVVLNVSTFVGALVMVDVYDVVYEVVEIVVEIVLV